MDKATLTTEQKILEVAKEVFFKKGYAGARMQDIADAAGINKALLHYYFRSKDKLFEIIFKEAASRFLPRVQSIIDSDATLFIKIEEFVNEYISILLQHPFIPMFVLNEVHKNPEEFFTRFFGEKKALPVKKFAEQVAKSLKEGLIKPVDPEHLLVNMISLCIFPFIARPMVQMATGMGNSQFNRFIEQRKKEVAQFVIDAIKV